MLMITHLLLSRLRKLIDLIVVTPRVFIQPGEDVHVQTGSDVVLTCVVDQVIHVPDHVAWIRNGKVKVQIQLKRGKQTDKTIF